MTLLLALFLFLFPVGHSVPAGAITVRVVDNLHRVPLGRAVVEIMELHRRDTTGDNGVCEFPKIPTGKYSIVARRIGFKRLTYLGIVVRPDSVTSVSISLEADDPMNLSPTPSDVDFPLDTPKILQKENTNVSKAVEKSIQGGALLTPAPADSSGKKKP